MTKMDFNFVVAFVLVIILGQFVFAFAGLSIHQDILTAIEAQHTVSEQSE